MKSKQFSGNNKYEYYASDLEAMKLAVNYHADIIRKFGKYIGEKVLEVGAGTGNLAEILLAECPQIKELVLTEPDRNVYIKLSEKFKNNNKVKVLNLFTSKLDSYNEYFDSVIYNNVLEHVENDKDEINDVCKNIKSNGHICTYSPARMELYSNYDNNLGHYRRYNIKDVQKLFESPILNIKEIKYSDFIGYFLWLVKYKLLKTENKKNFVENVKFFDKYIQPINRNIEKHFNLKIGKNILAICQIKREETLDLLSIVVPAYNEENSIIKMLNKLIGVLNEDKINFEIFVVNDGSKDNTLKLLKDYSKRVKVNIVDNKKNIGKSRSVTKGIKLTKGNYVIIQDSDLEYDPNDIVKMYYICKNNKLDFIYGNRFNGKVKILYKSFFIGNKGISFISNIFTFPKLRKLIPDMEVCYKLIKGDIARDIASELTATSNFGFEPEVTARLANYKINGKHLKFDILPISYFPRTIEQGKKIRWKDGFKAIGEIIKYNLAK